MKCPNCRTRLNFNWRTDEWRCKKCSYTEKDEE